MITRLVDGSLRDAERPALEAWARQEPAVARQVASQRRVAHELGTGGPAVPPRLAAAVQAQLQARDQRGAWRSLRAWAGSVRRPRLAIAGGALVALCAAAVILAIGTAATNSAPSITAAAQLAFAPSTGTAPAAQSSRLLDVSYAGVHYPNYAAQFAVVPTGRRLDRIGGRLALTVFYRLNGGSRLSYTVFSGTPVPLPSDARSVVFDGVPLHVFSTRSGLAVVTLVRFGRTCVLAAPTTRDLVLALAAAPIHAQAA